MIPIRGVVYMIPDMMVLFIVALLSTLSIASTSIGINIYNKNQAMKDENTSNHTYLTIHLVISIGLLIMSGGALLYNLSKH